MKRRNVISLLNNDQIEQYLSQYRLRIQSLETNKDQQTAQLNSLQQQLLNLQSSTVTSPNITVNAGALDSYQVSAGILHKLVHIFNGLVKLVGGALFPSLTASRPLKIDSGNAVIADKIDLAAPTTDIKNTLGVPNGGTGQTTLTLNQVLLGNGASGINSIAGITGNLILTIGNSGLSLTVNTTTIQYKDWTGTNQSATLVTSVTLNGAGTYLTSASLTNNAFTNGVRTT